MLDLTLDHVGVIAHDLASAAARWERLGFTLAPLSRQRGAVPGETGMRPWATANRCVILRQGYLELIGTVDAAAYTAYNPYNPWTRFLARFEGMHLLALRCAEADAAYARLAPDAPFLDPPIARERKLVYRSEERSMRFRNIFSRDADCPEGRYIVIEHQTPELLWQDELMAHANGALALEEAVVVGDDAALAALAARVRALAGVPQLMSAAQFAARYDWTPPAPCFAAVTIAFADLERTLVLLEGRGVAVHRKGTDVWLAPEDTNGFVMRLVQHA